MEAIIRSHRHGERKKGKVRPSVGVYVSILSGRECAMHSLSHVASTYILVTSVAGPNIFEL